MSIEVRPANLGGGHTRNTTGTALVEADFIEAYQDHLTRQWRGKVRLDGGRVVDGVRFLYPGSRVTAGQRPPLPAKGERGLVGYPSSRRQIKTLFWLGSIDGATYGMDTDHPDSDVKVHPSGQANITDKDGNHAHRYANNDMLWMDSPAGSPLEPGALKTQYRQHPRPVAELKDSGGKREGPSRHFYQAAQGALYGAQMQLDGRRGELYLNNAESKLQIFAADDSVSYWVKGATDCSPGLHLGAEGKGNAELDLQAKGLLRLVAERDGKTGSIEIDPASGRITLDTQDLLELVTKVLHIQAKTLKADAANIELNAQKVTAGQGAGDPVAMSSKVDANFRAIAAILGVPVMPTGSTILRSR